MQKYADQLLADIAYATEHINLPFVEEETDLWDWIPDEEEDKTAPVRDLQECTGIRKEQLPPAEMLTVKQVHLLLEALKKMLDEYNWCFVMQIEVPERIQYAALRDNFDQQAKVKRWHYGFFELCRPDAENKKCALGEYCHFAFFEELFSGFEDEYLTPEEERERELRWEIEHLQKKYGDDWGKYSPYHLDKNYDDEYGNPYDYGFGAGDKDEDKNGDDWWRK